MNIGRKCKSGILAIVLVVVIWGYLTSNDKKGIVYANTDKQIIAITREKGSGTRSAFIDLTGLESRTIWGKLVDTTAEEIAVAGSTQEMIRQIELLENGIGYVSMGALDIEKEQIKVLRINDKEATNENITLGTYNLVRPLNLVYSGELSELEKDFLSYLKSKGQGIITKTYYIPVRNEGIYLKKDVKGTIIVNGSSSMGPLMTKLAKAYMNENPDIIVQIKMTDSEDGVHSVLQGESSFGMVSRNLHGYEAKLLTKETIARDGIAVIVNSKSKIENITINQLRKIYKKKL